MTPAIQEKLDKVFALYNDPAAQETKESQAAYGKLRDLCKAHKVNFAAYMRKKNSEGKRDEKPESTTSEDSTTNAMTFKSRRGFVISLLREGLWDRKSIAEAVANYFPNRYTDLKKNAAAVTGTINDLRSNKGADITVCDATGRILYKV